MTPTQYRIVRDLIAFLVGVVLGAAGLLLLAMEVASG
jgi:hypothetical protein